MTSGRMRQVKRRLAGLLACGDAGSLGRSQANQVLTPHEGASSRVRTRVRSATRQVRLEMAGGPGSRALTQGTEPEEVTAKQPRASVWREH